MEFSRPEYWSGQLFPSPGKLPNPGIEPKSLALWADSLQVSHKGSPCGRTSFIGRTETKAEAPILWPPDAKSQLIRKDCDAGKD